MYQRKAPPAGCAGVAHPQPWSLGQARETERLMSLLEAVCCVFACVVCGCSNAAIVALAERLQVNGPLSQCVPSQYCACAVAVVFHHINPLCCGWLLLLMCCRTLIWSPDQQRKQQHPTCLSAHPPTAAPLVGGRQCSNYHQRHCGLHAVGYE